MGENKIIRNLKGMWAIKKTVRDVRVSKFIPLSLPENTIRNTTSNKKAERSVGVFSTVQRGNVVFLSISGQDSPR